MFVIHQHSSIKPGVQGIYVTVVFCFLMLLIVDEPTLTPHNNIPVFTLFKPVYNI